MGNTASLSGLTTADAAMTALEQGKGENAKGIDDVLLGELKIAETSAQTMRSPSSATSLSADTPPAAPWTPNSTEQSMLRDVAKTTEDPAQFASIMKEKVATFRAENSGTDDIFKGSPYDQGPEKLDQYLTDQFESTKLSLNTELADQEARAVK